MLGTARLLVKICWRECGLALDGDSARPWPCGGRRLEGTSSWFLLAVLCRGAGLERCISHLSGKRREGAPVGVCGERTGAVCVEPPDKATGAAVARRSRGRFWHTRNGPHSETAAPDAARRIRRVVCVRCVKLGGESPGYWMTTASLIHREQERLAER